MGRGRKWREAGRDMADATIAHRKRIVQGQISGTLLSVSLIFLSLGFLRIVFSLFLGSSAPFVP
jgi:hypothetical protein